MTSKINENELLALGLSRPTVQAIRTASEKTSSSVTISADEIESLIFQLDNRADLVDKLRTRCDALELVIMTQPDFMSYIRKLEAKIKELEEIVWRSQ